MEVHGSDWKIIAAEHKKAVFHVLARLFHEKRAPYKIIKRISLCPPPQAINDFYQLGCLVACKSVSIGQQTASPVLQDPLTYSLVALANKQNLVG